MTVVPYRAKAKREAEHHWDLLAPYHRGDQELSCERKRELLATTHNIDRMYSATKGQAQHKEYAQCVRWFAKNDIHHKTALVEINWNRSDKIVVYVQHDSNLKPLIPPVWAGSIEGLVSQTNRDFGGELVEYRLQRSTL